MKTLAYFLFNFFFLTHFAFDNGVQAQSNSDDDNQVTITIKKNINGEESESTTSFSLDDLNLDEIMENLDIDMEELEKSLDKMSDELENLDLDIKIDIDGMEDIMEQFHQNFEFDFDIDEDGDHKVIMIKAHDDDNPNKGFLGIVPAHSENGVLINQVIEGSGAQKAGLKEGDVIKSIGNTDMNSMDDLYEALGETEKGETIKIKYLREGKNESVKATLGEAPAKDMHVMKHGPNKFHCTPKPSCDSKAKRGFLGIHMDGQENQVKVTKVVEGSAAEQAGMKAGDILENLNGAKIKSMDDVSGVMKDTKPGDKLDIGVIRDSQHMNLTAALGQHQSGGHHKMVWKSKEIQRPFLGVSLKQDDKVDGIQVLNVIEGSAAEKAGINEGDIIKSVNNVKVNDTDDLIHEIRSQKTGEEVDLIINREGEVKNIKATLESKTFSHCGPDFSKFHEDFEFDMNGDEGKVMKFKMKDGDKVIEKIIQIDELEDGENQIRVEITDGDEVEVDEDLEPVKEAPIVEEIFKAENNFEELAVEELSFYPNPNDGRFRLVFAIDEKADTEILILDSQGKEVYKEYLDEFSGEYDNMIDISDNSSGTYIMQITQGEKMLNERIVIQ